MKCIYEYVLSSFGFVYSWGNEVFFIIFKCFFSMVVFVCEIYIMNEFCGVLSEIVVYWLCLNGFGVVIG